MVVLAILALIGGLVLTRGPGRHPDLDARAGAIALVQDLRRARARAMAQSRAITVVFGASSYVLDLDSPERHALPPGDVLRYRTAIGGAQSSDEILFAPDGSASGGGLEWQAPSGATWHIGIDWLTGRISGPDAK